MIRVAVVADSAQGAEGITGSGIMEALVIDRLTGWRRRLQAETDEAPVRP